MNIFKAIVDIVGGAREASPALLDPGFWPLFIAVIWAVQLTIVGIVLTISAGFAILYRRRT